MEIVFVLKAFQKNLCMCGLGLGLNVYNCDYF